MFLDNLFTSFWIFLPAALSNTLPVMAAKTPILKNYNFPLDFGKTYKGKRIFGSHKTIRGLIIGVTTAILVVYLQKLLFHDHPSIQSKLLVKDYSELNTLFLGAMSGLGGILGDATKSFFKRRKGVPPGTSWPPFDQIDYVIGGLIFIYPILQPTPVQIILIFVIYTALHPISTLVGYLLGLKASPI